MRSFLTISCRLIGSILRRLPLVRIFSRTLNWLFAVNVISGIATIILLFVANKQEVIDACINGSTDQHVIDVCNDYDTYRYVMIVLIVFGWTLHFCKLVYRHYAVLMNY